jgi:excinuclease ABC subunit C
MGQDPPPKPGVYYWKNSSGDILYIGKAKNLSKRLAYYNKNPKKLDIRTRRWRDQATSVEWIQTASEDDALSLEYAEIRKHRPAYNIRLKDENHHRYLKWTNEDLPRLVIVREPDGAMGPYRGRLHELLKLIDGVWFNPIWGQDISRQWPHRINRADYKIAVDSVNNYLAGDTTQLDAARQRMLVFARAQNYEAAGQIRDRIQKLESWADSFRPYQADKVIVSVVRQSGLWSASFVVLKQGTAINTDTICGYGSDLTSIKEHLPQAKGEDSAWQNITTKNAQNKLLLWQKEVERKTRLEELSEILQMEIKKVECYDISHTSGECVVGAMSSLHTGGSQKSRTWILSDGNDDYRHLAEVLDKRLAHRESLPDLIIIDGGVGQWNAVSKLLSSLKIPHIAIAKQNETIYGIDGEIIPINCDHPASLLVQSLRDNAHATAISRHRKLMRKKMLDDPLLRIPGIGLKTAQKLRQKYGHELSTTPREDLQELVGKRLGGLIYDYYHK